MNLGVSGLLFTTHPIYQPPLKKSSESPLRAPLFPDPVPVRRLRGRTRLQILPRLQSSLLLFSLDFDFAQFDLVPALIHRHKVPHSRKKDEWGRGKSEVGRVVCQDEAKNPCTGGSYVTECKNPGKEPSETPSHFEFIRCMTRQLFCARRNEWLLAVFGHGN